MQNYYKNKKLLKQNEANKEGMNMFSVKGNKIKNINRQFDLEFRYNIIAQINNKYKMVIL